MISEKAVCNSISFMHNVAFLVIPFGVLDNDHNIFFSPMENTQAVLKNQILSLGKLEDI